MERLLRQAQLILQTGHGNLRICLPLLLFALKPSHRSALPTTNSFFVLLFSEICLCFFNLLCWISHNTLQFSSSLADTGCRFYADS